MRDQLRMLVLPVLLSVIVSITRRAIGASAWLTEC